ncbi:MAG: ATP-binding cassette domain-containing protein, partial [Ligilactobacillus agilis]|nr:ATP-binding cassette domain-containing protein [Ligilactobacillus agilis]
MTDAIIDFKDFSFRYESQAHPTLKKINLQIYPGEKICICGPSGSGKSTLLQCLNGLIPNQYEGEIKGQALVAGKDITKTTMFDLSFETGTVLQDTDSQF